MTHHRNDTLEILKLAASYMVVFIHVLFYGNVGAAADALARFAVPFFFIISGFYSYGITPERVKKRIGNIAQLILLTVVLYLGRELLHFFAAGDMQGMVSYFGVYAEPVNLVKLVVFNAPVYTMHLWYLLAMLYVYILYFLAVVWSVPEKWIFTGGGLLLVLHLLLGEGLSVLGIVAPVTLIRNFALMGIPFFAMGLLIRKYSCKVSGISGRILMAALLAGAAETLLSRGFFGKNELYLGSVLMAVSLMAFSLKHAQTQYPKAVRLLAGCSTYIYILHILVSTQMLSLYEHLGVDYPASVTMQMIHPLLVCAVSTVLALGIGKVSAVWRKDRKPTEKSTAEADL